EFTINIVSAITLNPNAAKGCKEITLNTLFDIAAIEKNFKYSRIPSVEITTSIIGIIFKLDMLNLFT
ncbi:hypothetical protein CON60_31250, partial [Bacillus toyonensis]